MNRRKFSKKTLEGIVIYSIQPISIYEKYPAGYEYFISK